MPSQHGIHFALPDKWEWYPENFDAVASFRTLPKTLKDNGYKTALMGKFHMGSPYTPQHGFDHWVPDEHGTPQTSGMRITSKMARRIITTATPQIYGRRKGSIFCTTTPTAINPSSCTCPTTLPTAMVLQ
jgi:hypothetical protein